MSVHLSPCARKIRSSLSRAAGPFGPALRQNAPPDPLGWVTIRVIHVQSALYRYTFLCTVCTIIRRKTDLVSARGFHTLSSLLSALCSIYPHFTSPPRCRHPPARRSFRRCWRRRRRRRRRRRQRKIQSLPNDIRLCNSISRSGNAKEAEGNFTGGNPHRRSSLAAREQRRGVQQSASTPSRGLLSSRCIFSAKSSPAASPRPLRQLEKAASNNTSSAPKKKKRE